MSSARSEYALEVLDVGEILRTTRVSFHLHEICDGDQRHRHTSHGHDGGTTDHVFDGGDWRRDENVDGAKRIVGVCVRHGDEIPVVSEVSSKDFVCEIGEDEGKLRDEAE
jgi:hypothetical protein